jgi:hypothetical protein
MAGVIERIKEHLSGLFDLPYVPEEMLTSSRPRILHVSDTPGSGRQTSAPPPRRRELSPTLCFARPLTAPPPGLSSADPYR